MDVSFGFGRIDMKNINFELIIGCVWVALIVGIALGEVGEMPKVCLSVYDWKLPFVAFVSTFFPLVFGFIAGRKSKP